MNGGTTSTLDASAKYDDQGLYFSIILGTVLTVLFCPFVLYLSSTSTLWLKRLYRPNHTIEPPLAAALSGGTAAGPPSPRSPLSPRADVEDMGTPSAAAAPVVRSSHGRRKRMGISLPYTSSFYQLPSWRDWWSVEESVPHLESALAEPSLRASSSASATAGTPDGTHSQDAGISDGAGEMLSPGSIDYRQVAGSHVFAPLSQSSGVTTPRQRKLAPLVGGSGSGGGGALGDERTPLSRSRNDAEKGHWEEARLRGEARVAQGSATRVNYGTVPAVTTDATAALADALPRTPLDPQVALYVFTLKYFITFLLVGCGFVSWICWIASSDDAFEWMLLRNDPHRCGKQGANETGCLRLQPYCTFLGSDIGCTAVPLPGLYDLTVKNIRPRSGLWWWVGLLNMGFVASFIVITLYFVQTADVYITKVMKMQMSAAMGYRVACVCGLGEQKKRARRQFEALYLSPEAYFPSTTTTASDVQHASPLAVRAKPKTRSVSEALQETVYRRLYCPGMSCLFSIARVHVYQTTVEQLVFAKPGRVKAILFTRKSPEGMYTAINAAEGAIANLQEAIAQQNALTRRKRYHERERSLAASYRSSAEVAFPRTPSSRATEEVAAEPAFVIISSTAHDGTHGRGGESAFGGPVLYQYVNCCHKVSAVPYREGVFRKEGERLNALLEEVPKQPATGAVFVEFTNSRSAFEFVNIFEARYGGVSSRASALIAGPPGHIIESNLNVDKFILALRFILLLGLYVLLLLTWSIPVGFVGSLDNIALVLGPAFRSWLYNDVPASLRSLAVAYLPVIVLALFNVLLPFLIRFIVIAMGAVNKSECDGGHLYLQYVFMVLTAVVFQAALQGSLAEIPNLIENMGTDQIVDLLVSCVTPQSGYWYAKVITSTALSTWLDLVDPIALLQAIFFRNRARVQRRYDAIFRPTEFQYPRLYSFDIMILSIGVLFHMTAPLLVPFVALFFVVRYLTQRAKLYDRYRPSFAAPHDCTDFGVSAQVMRAVITLLCFAEMCGLFVMSLKKHTGGMMLCSATLGASLVLAVYIYVQTRTWITTLGNARRFFPGEVYTSPASAAAADPREGPFSSRASSPTAASPAVVPREADDATTQDVGGDRQSEDDGGWSDDSSLRTFSDVSMSPGTPVMSEHASAPDRDNETSDANQKAQSRRRRRQRRQRAQMLLEDDVMDEYENLRVLPSISGRSTNPFIGHLLPRKPGLRHLYQPKHQRLAVIDVDKEVSAMMETEFVVERYWDRGMTWFEADAVEVQDGGAPPSPAARSASESSVASTSHTATYRAPAANTASGLQCETESVRAVGEETDLPSSPAGPPQSIHKTDEQLDEL